MSVKQLKFYRRFKGSILRGEKTSTIREGTDINVGEVFEAIECSVQSDFFISMCRCRKISYLSFDKNGRTSITPEKENELLKSEGFSEWVDLTEFIKQQYRFPFFGVVIEWDLIGEYK